MGQPLDFHSGIALSKDQTKAFVCDVKESNTLSMFQFDNGQWNKSFTYSENKFPLLMVQLSHDEVVHFNLVHVIIFSNGNVHFIGLCDWNFHDWFPVMESG